VCIVWRCHGRFESPQDVIAECDRVGQILEAKGVLGEARDRERPRNRAERDHEIAIGDAEKSFVGLDLDAPAVGLVRDGAPEHEVGMRAHQPQARRRGAAPASRKRPPAASTRTA
jgi:hypothetical protein